MRFHKSIKGNLCKSCINDYFWRFTMITVAVGWLGFISLILAPIFVINNVVRYLGCLSLKPVPVGAQRPQLTQAVMTALQPHTPSIAQRINAKESFEKIATDVSYASGVTPGQVILYMRAMLAAARK